SERSARGDPAANILHGLASSWRIYSFRYSQVKESNNSVIRSQLKKWLCLLKISYTSRAQIATCAVSVCRKVHVLDGTKHGATFFNFRSRLAEDALHNHRDNVR